MKDKEVLKCNIEGFLRSTQREGIENLIEYMNKNNFYDAPCSSQYHLCYEGGLAEHSLNVFGVALEFNSATGEKVNYNSLILVTLLHDIGKIGINGSRHYEPNILRSGEVSKSKPYETNKDLLGMPHEILSLEIISKFIELTIEEQQAILYHNGLYTPLGNGIKGKETPLYLLLHFADMWASRVIEKEEN